MCGIAGYIGFTEDVDPSGHLLQNMIHCIGHRGPDGLFHKKWGNIGLAHARLKILDLSDAANQPFVDPSQRYVLVYNGEIYNHLTLRQSLTFQDFRSQSDTETLLHALIEQGEQIVSKLNGIFSFVFVDLANQKVIAARDRYGVKPLYFSEDKDAVYFASEIGALLQNPEFKKGINVKAKHEYIALLSAQEGKTIYKNIQKLPPAHVLTINGNDKTIKMTAFWEIPSQRTYIKDSALKIINATEELLIAAVKRQLMGDVPIGFFLSGGVDSSLLVAMAQKHGGITRPTCFTIKQQTQGFENDYPYAQRLAQSLGLNLQVVEKPNLDLAAIDHILNIIEEPIMDLSAINVSLIAQEAQKIHLKVLISGLGADDTFTGYRRHLLVKQHDYLKYLPIGLLRQIENACPDRSNMKRWIHKFVSAWHKDPHIFLAQLHAYTTDEYLGKHTAQNAILHLAEFIKRFAKNVDMVDKALALELYNYLPNQNLLYTDKAAMRYGVEVRVPYLDNELTDYLYNVPAKLKIKGLQTKYILREIAGKYLPKEIIYRKKVGFSEMPDVHLRQQLQEKLSNTYDAESLAGLTANPQLLLNLYAVDTFTRPIH